MKKNCRKLLLIFLLNILYKKLFATNFVENTYEFYNFVGIITHEGITVNLDS